MIIKTSESVHVPGIYALVEELAVYEKAREEMTMTLEGYHTAFNEGQFKSFVALDDEANVIGTCIYYDTFSTWKGKMLYLEDFVVSEAYRRFSIGQKLFDAYLDRAKVLKCRLAKWQVLDWNQPALNFYLKNDALIEKGWWNGKIFL